MSYKTDDNCLFCKIIAGKIPSFKLLDTDKTYAFLDIGPLSKGHCLLIPKYHGERLHDVPEEHLSELLPLATRLAKALDVQDYNILQNNGAIAHQEVKHVHVHLIPKPNEKEGLGVSWPQQHPDKEELKALAERVASRL